jgi:CubicO group peptidase (beta-lactamase class C family)
MEAVPAIDGTCDPRFRGVREAFARNFAKHDEVGAAVSIRIGGAAVVDLWGGYVDPDRTIPWRRDSLVNTYSVGKGVLATLVLALAERGYVDFDAPVTDVWPEFGAAGKARVTLRTLLAHRAGLPAVRERQSEGTMLDWERMCGALASQTPYWEPDTRHGYHINTLGFLVGNVLRCITGTRVGETLRTHVTGPLEADYWWGLPQTEHRRVATVCTATSNLTMRGPEDWAKVFPPSGDTERDYMVWHTYFNPSGLSGFGAVNTREWRLAEIPSTNGHGTARAVSSIYEALLGTGSTPPLAGQNLLSEAIATWSDGEDAILGQPSRFGLGFQLPQPSRPLGPNPRAFGHFGYGGSLGFADPEAGIAFSYLMNRPGERWQTPRTQALIDALYESLGAS